MREKNNKYRYIGQRLIRSEPDLQHIKDYGIKIAYLESDEEKIENHKVIMADCTLVSKKYKWCCPYDFFITVYEPNIRELSEKQIEVLILHELHHVGVDDTKMEPKPYIVPHDVEEFTDIINRYGLYWDTVGVE
ncbi:MAG: hypothetical protein MJ097_00505 [Dorea sp.]|nr:hypothetical protein [Dorea sp.]